MDATRAHSEDSALSLPPWSGAQHLAALRRHIVPGPGVPRLDAAGYAAELLWSTDVDEDDWPALTARALRWAVHPERGPARDDGRFVALSCGTRIRMGDCAWTERYAAACEARRDAGEEPADDPVRVVERILAQVLEGAEPGGATTLRELSASSLVQLAGAVLDRYDRALTDDDLEALDMNDEPTPEPERARMILALHRSLGRLRPPPHSPPRRRPSSTRWPVPSPTPDPPFFMASIAAR